VTCSSIRRTQASAALDLIQPPCLILFTFQDFVPTHSNPLILLSDFTRFYVYSKFTSFSIHTIGTQSVPYNSVPSKGGCCWHALVPWYLSVLPLADPKVESLTSVGVQHRVPHGAVGSCADHPPVIPISSHLISSHLISYHIISYHVYIYIEMYNMICNYSLDGNIG